ncbi:iron chaperone [Sediminibacterium soli]|uniref:iron chaperone n=1 Tax=Sediminibacterium soli TaxID=2698829 RepID=UPI00137AA4D6|nr:DUF1801 domain-containing protein [Sediminibacterium soli]NCI46367.1 hypothetical protein [Sediminibacterium soli]
MSNSIDNYIAPFPEDTRERLQKFRETIAKAAPGAEETIGYGIPTFVLAGNLVHFAGYKNHIGFYPASSAIREFADELAVYKTAKGSIQFPLDQKMPWALITRMVKFRVKENLAKARAKAGGRKK